MNQGRAVAWAVAGQVGIVVGLVAWKQVTVVTGQTVVLRCEPRDPRDLLRGEYVVLDYDIAKQMAPDGPPPRRGETMYLRLERDGRFHGALGYGGLSRTRPGDAPTWIAGTVTDTTGAGAQGPRQVTLDFVIGTYSVPRGRGARFEQEGWKPGKMLAATVKIDRFGRAVLRRVDVVPRDRSRSEFPFSAYPAPIQPGKAPAAAGASARPGTSVIVPAEGSRPVKPRATARTPATGR